MKNWAEKFESMNLRAGRTIILACATTNGSASEELSDFLSDSDVETLESIFGDIPEQVKIAFRNYQDEDVIQWLRDECKFGLLIRFETPVCVYVNQNTRSYFWGYYNTKWIYSDSLDTAFESGLAWAKNCHDEEFNKGMEKAKAATEGARDD